MGADGKLTRRFKRANLHSKGRIAELKKGHLRGCPFVCFIELSRINAN
jgi:hypothetical protein